LAEVWGSNGDRDSQKQRSNGAAMVATTGRDRQQRRKQRRQRRAATEEAIVEAIVAVRGSDANLLPAAMGFNADV